LQISDLSNSWKDGLAFCAIVHHYYPEQIDFQALDRNDWVGNLELAFGILGKLGIDSKMDANEVANNPDKRMIRNYLLAVSFKLTGKDLTKSRVDPIPGPFSSRMSLPGRNINPDLIFKVILLGDSGVGKSTLFERWKNDLYVPTTITVGIEIYSRYYSCEGKVIQIQVWDTAGQEAFRSITRSYYRDAKGALLVYDITKEKTFENISTWSKDLFDTLDQDVKIPVLLVGNKDDLEDKRTVSTEVATEYAARNSFQYIETSAKQGHDCQRSFQLLFQHIYKVYHNNTPRSHDNTNNTIQLHPTYHTEEPLPDPPLSKNCSCSF
jgi:Ras-related protein Rab-11A